MVLCRLAGLSWPNGSKEGQGSWVLESREKDKSWCFQTLEFVVKNILLD